MRVPGLMIHYVYNAHHSLECMVDCLFYPLISSFSMWFVFSFSALLLFHISIQFDLSVF